jgi:signal transduction histidine kinase
LGLGSTVIGKKCYELIPNGGCGYSNCRVFARQGIVEYEYRACVDGHDEVFLIAAVPYYNEKGNRAGILQAVTDITQMRKLEKELISISDRERLLISQELHDGIGQVLTGMSYLVEKLIRRMRGTNSSELKIVQDISSLTHEAIEKTRNITKGLMPVFVSKDAMFSSILHLADDIRQLFGIVVQLELAGMPDNLSRDEMTQLYYIIKEAIHNSVKHGHPSTISVTWISDNGSYELSIRDDGLKGILSVERSGGMGLNIMKYRAGLIGASLFSGFEGNGFLVRIKKNY